MALQLTATQVKQQTKSFEDAAGLGIPWPIIIGWLLKNGPLAIEVVMKVIPFVRGGGSVADAMLWAEACFAASTLLAGPPLTTP